MKNKITMHAAHPLAFMLNVSHEDQKPHSHEDFTTHFRSHVV